MENKYKKLKSKLKKIKTKEIKNENNIFEFKNKRILTFGTFDCFHIGHSKIIEHCIGIGGSESNVFVGVSSDKWNELKGKKSYQNEVIRLENIKRKYPNINVFLEDHDKPEKTWPSIWEVNKIDLIVMGGDHYESLSYINGKITPSGEKMKIVFFERTPIISSSLIKKEGWF